MARKKKIPWTKAQLFTLHECWKAAKSRQECLALVTEKLPEMPPPIAWSLIRKLSKSDREWQITTKQKEREKEEQKLAKERNRQKKLQRREEREQEQEWKAQRERLRSLLDVSHVKKISQEVGDDFFFCTDAHQHVCRLSCIFRIFSGYGAFGFSHGGCCEQCERMDEYIPTLEQIIGAKDEK